MKIHLHKKGVIIIGKPWEIREKLKEYRKQYDFLQEWIFAKKKKIK